MKQAKRKDLAARVRSKWWARCLLATEHDKLGLILRAAMAMPTNSPPWLGPSAIISADGYVFSNYVDEKNKMHVASVVCPLSELLDNLRRLVDMLKLSDVEAHALFAKIREWIKDDHRPATEQAEDRVPIEYRTKH